MKSNYLIRHAENLESAGILLRDGCEKHYASVHCSYYAAYQLIMHICKVKGIKSSQYLSASTGSHNQTISAIFSKFKEIDKKEAAKFNRTVNALKHNRVQADYEECYINKSFSKSCMEMAQHLTLSLSKHFDIAL